MRSSGANGLPLLIPIEASSPRVSASVEVAGGRVGLAVDGQAAQDQPVDS
jgi:hypothetical protein